MGVRSAWIIDPELRTGWTTDQGQWVEARRLEVIGTEIFVELDDLFAKLDESRACER